MRFLRKNIPTKKRKFTDSGAVFQNPYQGWYRPYLFPLNQAVDWEELPWVMVEAEPLCLLEFDLSAYASGKISEEGLLRCKEILDFFQSHHKQMILRFAYDYEGKAMVKEPTDVEIIYEHMKQVARVVVDYARSLVCIQGLFVGNWGEMHSSRYDTTTSLDGLYETFRDAFGERVILGVRRLELFLRWSAQDARISLFDDGICGSENDLGTYEMSRYEAYEILQQKMGCLPVGGELLSMGLLDGCFDAERVRKTFQGMQLCYLNSQYEKRALELLDTWGLRAELNLRMGYRLLVTDAKLQDGRWQICVENVGFGGLAFPLTLFLFGDGQLCEQQYWGDGIKPGERISVMFAGEWKAGTYDIQGSIYDAAITFANEGGMAVRIGEVLHA
ncbi:MAG: DUF4874 domain-containing protein [Lachnospiraceae bacterium]|nr:DUF4874 domain-containing protein [Lachnospiraceae bacterium]